MYGDAFLTSCSNPNHEYKLRTFRQKREDNGYIQFQTEQWVQHDEGKGGCLDVTSATSDKPLIIHRCKANDEGHIDPFGNRGNENQKWKFEKKCTAAPNCKIHENYCSADHNYKLSCRVCNEGWVSKDGICEQSTDCAMEADIMFVYDMSGTIKNPRNSRNSYCTHECASWCRELSNQALCNSAKTDSEKWGHYYFHKEKFFTEAVLGTFGIKYGVAGIQVGFLSYGTNQELTTFKNNQRDVFKSLNNMMFKEMGVSNTANAVSRAVSEFSKNGRKNVRKMIFVLTRKNFGQDQSPQLKLKAIGKEYEYLMFAVGIGNLDQAKLIEVANGNTEHVFKVDNYNALSNIASTVTSKACNVDCIKVVNKPACEITEECITSTTCDPASPGDYEMAGVRSCPETKSVIELNKGTCTLGATSVPCVKRCTNECKLGGPHNCAAGQKCVNTADSFKCETCAPDEFSINGLTCNKCTNTVNNCNISKRECLNNSDKQKCDTCNKDHELINEVCQPCNPTAFSADGKVCQTCQTHAIANFANCKAASFVSGCGGATTDITCSECKVGYGFNSITGSCTKCSADKYSDGTGPCVACTNKVNNCDIAKQECLNNSDKQKCDTCNKDHELINEVCQPCNSTAFSTDGKVCQTCQTHAIANIANCKAGSFVSGCGDSTTDITCSQCKVGYGFSSATGSCTKCVANEYSDGTGPCVACPAGEASDGSTPCANINECNLSNGINPCLNNGTCHDEVNRFSCTCKPGFNGTTCGNDIDECKVAEASGNDPCSNNGFCNDGIDSYTCTCKDGFNGVDCSNNINECKPSSGVNPCFNNGTCHDGVNGYTCTCKPGFNGPNCNNNINECKPASGLNPCLNNGTCHDGVNGYTCTCKPGFNGPNCNNNINECKPASGMNPCLNNGTCHDGVNGYTCTCKPGFNGPNCNNNINECKPASGMNPCLNNGICHDGVNGYTCTCKPGFNGPNCNNNINECKPASGINPCLNNGVCKDGINAFTCSCLDGFSGSYCETTVNTKVDDRSNTAKVNGDEAGKDMNIWPIVGGTVGGLALVSGCIGAGMYYKKMKDAEKAADLSTVDLEFDSVADYANA
eukprot:Pgem_evm1s3548